MSEEASTTKYSSYTPAQKRASQLYRQKNKDKINEQRKKYYQTRKATDPKFLEYKRLKAKEYYEKKKLNKVISPLPEVNTEMKEPEIEQPKLVEQIIEQVSKMEITTPEPSFQPSTPLKGKRSSKSKKLKTDLEKVD